MNDLIAWIRNLQLLDWLIDPEVFTVAQRLERTALRLIGQNQVNLESEPRSLLAVLNSAATALEQHVTIHEAKSPKTQVNDTPLVSLPEEPSKPGATVQDLISLRDWLLLIYPEIPEPTNKVVERVYKKLGTALEKENIGLLEDKGVFNPEYQLITSTEITVDPAKDNHVCESVRPGYLFNNKVLRPQEVILYVLQK